MLKKVQVICMMILVMLGISACSNDGDITGNTLIINKSGAVTAVMIEDFSEEYYNMSELETMVKNEIADYNSVNGQDKVTLKEVKDLENGQVYMSMEFADADTYADFNEMKLFAGTVSDAYSAKETFVDMKSVNQDNGTLSDKDVLEKGSMKIIIVEEDLNVRVPGKITYISDGVNKISNKEATVSTDENYGYIMYE